VRRLPNEPKARRKLKESDLRRANEPDALELSPAADQGRALRGGRLIVAGGPTLVRVSKALLEDDGTVVEILRDGSERPVEPQVDWARVDATTEEEIAAQIAEDEAEAMCDAARAHDGESAEQPRTFLQVGTACMIPPRRSATAVPHERCDPWEFDSCVGTT
jgi:hypothetical protein